MNIRSWTRLTTALLICAGTALAQAAAPRVAYYEKLEQLERVTGKDARERLSFEAFGRRYVFELEPNVAVTRALDPAATSIVPLAGTVVGEPGSWVRVTRTPQGLSGMLWDGRELYAIEPASQARSMLDASAQLGSTAKPGVAAKLASSDIVMYRLADLTLDANKSSCGTSVAQSRVTAKQAFQALSQELQTAAATAPTKQITIGALGDFELVQAQGGADAARAYMAARLNVVDGIFSSQVGVRVRVGSITVFETASDPFTSTDAGDLLDELSAYRFGNSTQRGYGLSHLYTGRSLDGTTVGIAFIGAICTTRSATSLTEARQSATAVALISAHEIGHNFGAPHDGEDACATSPQTFLMASQLNGNDRFSQCSLEQMQALALGGSCLASVSQPDVEIVAPVTTTRHALDETFSITFNVRSIGGSAANNVIAAFTIPAGVTLESIAAAGGAGCTAAPGTASCPLGNLDSGVNRSITLSLTGRVIGSGALGARVSALNDGFPGNDTANVTISTEALVDLSTTIAAAPATLALNDATTVTVTAANVSTATANDARLSISLPNGLSLGGINAGDLSCTTATNSVSCAPAVFAAGSARTITLTLNATQAGTQTVTALLLSSALDRNTGNDSASVGIAVAAPAGTTPVASGGGGGGGGGRVGLLVLAMLLAAIAIRLARARRPGAQRR